MPKWISHHPAATEAEPDEMTYEEGDKCPEGCGGALEFPPVENCSCHKNPPCAACTNNRLECSECGWEEPAPEPLTKPTPAIGDWYAKWREQWKRGHTFAHGGRVFEVRHGSSGSTHVITGQYEGPVTAQDIIGHFGSGTFGHRAPQIGGGRFRYTKITD